MSGGVDAVEGSFFSSSFACVVVCVSVGLSVVESGGGEEEESFCPFSVESSVVVCLGGAVEEELSPFDVELSGVVVVER